MLIISLPSRRGSSITPRDDMEPRPQSPARPRPRRRQANCSSPTAAKSPSAFSARPRNSACAPSRSTRRKTGSAIHRFKADEAYLVGEGKGPVGAYLDIAGIVALAKEKGRGLHPSRLRISFRERGFRAGVRGGGHHFRRPARWNCCEMMGDKTAARALAQKVNVPVLPGNGRADRRPRRGVEDREANRFSAHHQGGVWRRRARHARGAQAGRSGGLARRGAGRGGPRVWQSGGVSGRVHSARQAHRGADSRRQARQRGSPARARLLGAAPAPEGHRDRAERGPGTARARRTVRRGGASSAAKSATTTPARWNSSTTSTRTNGSSSR